MARQAAFGSSFSPKRFQTYRVVSGRPVPPVPVHVARRCFPSRLKSTLHPTTQPQATTTPSTAQTHLGAGAAALKPRYPLPPSHFALKRDSLAEPPPSHGPPRLVRFPSPDYSTGYGTPTFSTSYSSSDGSSSFTYARPAANRLFGFYNAATATSQAPSKATLGSLSSHDLTSSNSVSTIPAMEGQITGLRNRGKESIAEKGHEHEHEDGHDHDHKGGFLGLHTHSHSHSHGAESSAEEADRLLAALKGKGDRGSNITVIGLIANLALCGAKGVAGVWLHSASLLADAAHSLSDTFSDVVTLFCWKMSQRPASLTHPLGYGKFETMGGLGVSVVLVAGALAIGLHSYGLLLEVLQPALQGAPKSIQALSSLTGNWASVASAHLHEHHHSVASSAAAASDPASAVLGAAESASASTKDGVYNSLANHEHNVLDPNAMWFALISILVKEWLYRATLKIAREENSSVLEANAIHHRSDSLSSGVTFLAIGGSYLGFPVLDPLGGLLVAGLIGKQGFELLIGALADLSDRGVEPSVLSGFESAIKKVNEELRAEAEAQGTNEVVLLGWKDLRAVRSGVSSFVDLTLVLGPEVRLKRARYIEEKVRSAIESSHKGVKEVRVHLDTPEE